ncbi:MAG: amylo-alpha-1,6-glucosidase, partial [Deferrisomatales bacterium]|nr:amylo-alpha-1,6-glucosidase [Deferrisomatales bacterium]
MHMHPTPGSRLIRHRGDWLTVTLSVADLGPGRAWLRTNLGRAAVRRGEVIAHAESGRAMLDRDWHDLPMAPSGTGEFTVAVPLAEVGVFRAKALFLPEGTGDPLWPPGDDVHLKVEPAEFCAANGIYSAFVRQHRPPETGSADRDRAVRLLEADGYTVIPRSGTFRDLIPRLDHIIGTLGFRILQLLPIHPTPTTFARMGRFGSPFAVMDFLDVDPALAAFDRRTTPLDQFRELVDAVHARGGRVFLDIPVNHTGWASWLQTHHPEWFTRNPDDTFRSPGAWGVVWGDLSQLEYGERGLWGYMARVFLHWCRLGVDGFRCDAGYMVPEAAWVYLVARVRDQFPETIFLLEGLGGPVPVMESLLGEAGLDWAYSELFQNYDREQVHGYLPGALTTSEEQGLLVHFAETHDNDRLAAVSPAWARLRTALAALTAPCGGFGITNGVEWFARDRVQVHGASELNWGAESNQVVEIARLNDLLARHPAFHPGARLELIDPGSGPVLALRRSPVDGADPVLAVVNLTPDGPTEVRWPTAGFPGDPLTDLCTGRSLQPRIQGERSVLPLGPGEALCLTAAPAVEPVAASAHPREPERMVAQRLRGWVADLVSAWRPDRLPTPEAAAAWARDLARDPEATCANLADSPRAPLTRWRWPEDLRRTAPVPPGHALWLQAAHPFRAALREPGVEGRTLCHRFSVPSGDGCGALLPPLPPSAGPRRLQLELTVFGPEPRRAEGPVLVLGTAPPTVRRRVGPGGGLTAEQCAVLTNGTGALAQVRARWGELQSLYDGLLAANLHPGYPVDRHLCLTRLRGWLVHRGYSQELGPECQTGFTCTGQAAVWSFAVPCGMGHTVHLSVALQLAPGRNAMRVAFSRAGNGDPDALSPTEPVRIILRPDVEDRSNHATTKAFAGPERRWPGAVRALPDGFTFTPDEERVLEVRVQGGGFTSEPEWRYAVRHPFEESRGLDGESDLFSPGYFTVDLGSGDTAALEAGIGDRKHPGRHDWAGVPVPGDDGPDTEPLGSALERALGAFVVRRDDALTVIAGYPWFLDWGRDTLITLRGLIAAGRHRESREILVQFARFEEAGTLPNMIRGADVSNRDTSDAPLWFGVACGDLAAATSDALFDTPAGGRTLGQVLASIARGYRGGTPNGIRVDPDSGLVFSPAHFTWMDTNHPASTPRQGYPVEIQALWWATLSVLQRIDPTGDWGELGHTVKRSLRQLYPSPERPWLADCLHAIPGTPARQAVADDHLRPNQLLAVTLGAVDDPRIARGVVTACAELLVPGAIRSLADRPVDVPLPVRR